MAGKKKSHADTMHDSKYVKFYLPVRAPPTPITMIATRAIPTITRIVNYC
ncbi:hypothetical protein [Neobacillus sp. CF12]|nr:hypothetical protein [Neobacillus sp. CF12]MDM5329931.1 hypothetical protein [Neobacillus sp. CF12]